MSADTDPVFLLGDKGAAFGGVQGQSVRTPKAVRAALGANRRARWFARRSADLALLEAHEARDTWHRLLLLEELSTAGRERLGTLFRVVVAPGGGVRLLSTAELADVLGAEHPEDYFIGGVVDQDNKALVLYRGNLERLVVPLSWFRSGRGSPRPNFDDFEVIDSGQTIRFGEYEAAADALLYDFDPRARRRMKDAELEKDESFGGALRRLRLSRGLSREDFPGINSKTIARIERGEVEKPHGATLETIAEALGVEAEEIGTY